jgi:hypothetical protein
MKINKTHSKSAQAEEYNWFSSNTVLIKKKTASCYLQDAIKANCGLPNESIKKRGSEISNPLFSVFLFSVITGG